MTDEAKAALQDFVRTCLPGRAFLVHKLAGDASTREYFRINLHEPQPGDAGSYVLMRMGEPELEPLFVSVQKVLGEAGIPVPAIHAFDPGRGLMLLSDFGDVTLEQAVAGAPEREWLRLYGRGIEIIADIQSRTSRHSRGMRCACFSLAFDTEKLMFEMDFFITHTLEIWKRAVLGRKEKISLRQELEALCRDIAAEPRVLCHRDYHSRNLMVLPGGDLGVIDFQDARMGPAQYDLVSLVHDSYVDMPESVRATLYDAFLNSVRRKRGADVDAGHFRYIYNTMTVQRNLKAAGSFAYLDCVRNMDRYLERMPHCLEHVRRAFDNLPDRARLRTLLAAHLPEIA